MGEFSDFKIHVTSDVDGATHTFEVHRSILRRLAYFRACFRSPFQEGSSGQMTLPESQPVMGCILKHLYGFGADELHHDIEHSLSSFPELLELYGSCDKYSIPGVREAAYQEWASRFNKISARNNNDFPESIIREKASEALTSLKQCKEEVNNSRFMDFIEGRLRFHRLEVHPIVLAKALELWPDLVVAVAIDYAATTDPRRRRSDAYRMRCVTCTTSWTDFRHGRAIVRCPNCHEDSVWEHLVVQAYLRNSD